VESFECGIEPFVVSGESAEACGPGEASFYHPTARQEHEASFGHRMFDHFETYAVIGCGRCDGLAGVTLVDVGQLDGIAGNLLHLLRECLDLDAITGIGRGHGQGHQVAQRVDRDMHLRSLATLGAVVTGAGAAFGGGLQRRLSMQTAVGWRLRPPNCRSSDCTSSTMRSKHPASIQRRICW
jgi:hypothetical protein